MSTTADHLASLDATLAAAKAAWEGEKKVLQEQILKLETELALRTRFHDDAIAAKEQALRTTAKLLTQFGVVSSVFEEAKQLAIDAGLYTKQTTEEGKTVHFEHSDSEKAPEKGA